MKEPTRRGFFGLFGAAVAAIGGALSGALPARSAPPAARGTWQVPDPWLEPPKKPDPRDEKKGTPCPSCNEAMRPGVVMMELGLVCLHCEACGAVYEARKNSWAGTNGWMRHSIDPVGEPLFHWLKLNKDGKRTETVHELHFKAVVAPPWQLVQKMSATVNRSQLLDAARVNLLFIGMDGSRRYPNGSWDLVLGFRERGDGWSVPGCIGLPYEVADHADLILATIHRGLPGPEYPRPAGAGRRQALMSDGYGKLEWVDVSTC